MGLISFGGVGSGIDTNSIIEALIEAERAPKQLSLDREEAKIQLTLTGLAALSESLDELKSIASELSSTTLYGQRKVTQSSTDYFSVSTSSTASVGSFDIEVSEVASGSKSETIVFTGGSSTTFGAGTLSFSAGTSSFNVTIEATDTLEDIRNKINETSNNFGVEVNLLNNVTKGADTGSVLVFESSVTGTGNDLSVTSSGDVSLQDLAENLTIAAGDEAKSAQIKFGSFTVDSDTNTFTDVIQGVTITAKKKNVATETSSFTVALDKSKVESKINDFIETYNGFNDVVKQLSIADPAEPGLLVGDFTLRSVGSNIRSLLTQTVSSAGASFNSLSALGISTTQSGSLELDSSVLSTALDENFENFDELFTGDNGFATKLKETIDLYTGSSGSITSREQTLTESMDRIIDQRIALDYRIQQLETRLVNQFAIMDATVAQFNSTGAYLAQQLANLPGFGSGSKDK